MAFASPVVRSPRALAAPRSGAPDAQPTPAESTAPDTVRDALTRAQLFAAVAHLPAVQVVDFVADWWDGQTHVPCLVVRGGRRTRRLRVVETTGDCVIVPFARRTAERWLAARRRPTRVELGIPVQRRSDDVVIDATDDMLRCRSPRCGALLPVGYAGGCPVCGAAGETGPGSVAGWSG